ncbi:MAG TPA: magnesium transporter [Gemmatimonadales bacterium]|nr:magnesium transporter [Gemmatimonadales bacterium]
MTDQAQRSDELRDLVREGALTEAVARAAACEPADLADVLGELDAEERLQLVAALPADVASQALVAMSEDAHAEDTLAALPPSLAGAIVRELDDDDAAELLRGLQPADAQRILKDAASRPDVGVLLQYTEETAGGRMTTHVVSVLDTDTTAEALERIRRQAEEVEDFYQVFVVDRQGVLKGVLSLQQLVSSRLERPVRAFMHDPEVTVPPEMDQEEVARLFARHDQASIPVVAADGRLLGRVTFDDVFDVVEKESTEDILQFGGTSPDEALQASWPAAVRSRLPWLIINLATAFLAASVVFAYQSLIQRLATLAVIMPVIAGMGGNAGTQALAVTVRRLALGLIPRGRFLSVIGKEALVGVINGVAVGIIVAFVALFLHQGPMLGVVVFLAMTGNLLVAGVAGAFIPMLLERRGVDPAVASSIFVSTFTDVCGFFLLLWLAGLLLL